MKFLTVHERPNPSTKQFSSSQDIANLMSDIGKMDRETVWILHLDARLQLIDRELVSMGSVSGTLAHPREIFRGAILRGASALIMVHNHPSGNPEPSPEDHALTRRIKQAADLLQFDFLDHVIVTPGGKYFSYSDKGLINA